jgi:hypothetical protein
MTADGFDGLTHKLAKGAFTLQTGGDWDDVSCAMV